jgi:hypothetical protein
VQSFAQACSFSIATLQWHTPVPGLGSELCHDRSHACLGFPRPWYRRCVTVALGVPSVMVSGLASGSGMRTPLWPILPSTDTRVVSVVLRVSVLRSTHNSAGPPRLRVLAYAQWAPPGPGAEPHVLDKRATSVGQPPSGMSGLGVPAEGPRLWGPVFPHLGLVCSSTHADPALIIRSAETIGARELPVPAALGGKDALHGQLT